MALTKGRRGQNLIMNMADHGYTVCAFNRTVSKVDVFLANEAKGKSIVGAHSVEEFVSKLKRPRRVMLLVQAGKAVDDWIETLLPLLEAGDIIIDGGNSHFSDSNRRTRYLAGKGIRFVGSGVSGGEEGARYGPSMMPGGSEEAWPYIKDIFQSIAAKSDGEACCEWVGDEGAGHYVKMVHNGIEYGDMQLICEVSSLPQTPGMGSFLTERVTLTPRATGVRHHEARPGPEQQGDWRRFRQVEHGRSGLLPDRDYPGYHVLQ
jgi:6-phosphogluconate dehydrogenase